MRILFIVDSMERLHFFLRLTSELRRCHGIFFATTEPLAAIIAKGKGVETFHLKKGSRRPVNINHKEIHAAAISAIEYLNEIYNLNTTKELVASFSEQLKEIIEKKKIEKIFIWNGQQAIGRAATLAASTTRVQKRYLEISNLPNKILVDEKGVNALSSIAKDVDILDSLPGVPDEQHRSWMKEYEEAKKGVLPQAVKNRELKAHNAINFLFKALLGNVAAEELVKKVRSVTKKSVTRIPSYCLTDAGPYIFLPLQVSTDTQIKLHSEYDNIDAIRAAYKLAISKNATLLVKIHPAERCQSEMRRIIDLQRTIDFKLSNQHTLNLIKNSLSVVTINSTVGLEALLYGKVVDTLGRCYYKDFNQSRLKKYIHQYLVSGISYFGNGPICYEQAETLIQR